MGRLGSYSVVPSRAFQNELGEQAPVGCRNPAGLSADCSSEIFKRSRQTELMLGLISMWQRWLTSYSKSSSRCLAYCPHLCPQIAARRPSSDVARQSLCSGSLAGWKTMAYIILEVIFKMSCLLSPSAGVKFADVPTQSWPSSGCFPRWIDNSAWVDWVLYTFHRCVHSTDLQLVGRLGSYSVCPRLRSRTSLECRRLLAVGIQQACPQIAARRSSSAVAIQSLCSGICILATIAFIFRRYGRLFVGQCPTSWICGACSAAL